ncbi:tRNA-dihydrouridine synthase family protein [bacterium]|nr:tRNA-dihydrouridine synthase family protein [bacterium]
MAVRPGPMTIKGLIINPPLVLAPMAEYTHFAFRQLLASFGGCGLYLSEMISAQKTVSERGWHKPLFRWTSDQTPFFFQIMGHRAEIMAEAIKMLSDLVDETGRGPAGFDLNMGCGAHWLIREGSGVALMKDISATRLLVRQCRAATSLPLTAKIRLGWEKDPDYLVRFGRMLEDEGVDAVTLHPRLAKEHFTGRARWQYIALLKEHLKIPVIGNGDVRDRDDIQTLFEQTQCDGVMLGRAAIRKPWLFSNFLNDHDRQPDPDAIMKSMFALLLNTFPEQIALVRFKQFLKFFADNFRFGHQLYWKVYNSRTIIEIIAIIDPRRSDNGNTAINV